MRRISLFLCLILSCTQIFAANDVYQKTLKNGLKVIVAEDHRAPIVINSVWYRVGSSYEHNGITGISHMLEHMMFRGTNKHKPGEFEAIVNKMGGEQNAITSYDHTVYYQVTGSQHLPTLFALEADRMRGLKLDPKLFEHEKKVVMEERRMRVDDSPVARASELTWATAYKSSPMHHPVIGWMNDIENYQLKDLKDWYNKWYQPNNAFLLVVGDVDHKKVFALAEKYFSKIPTAKIPVLKPRKEALSHSHKRLKLDVPSKNRYVLIAYQVPSVKTAANEKEVYALSLLNTLLAGGTSSKLYTDMVLGKHLATAVDSSYTSPFLLHSGLFYLLAIPNKSVKNDDIIAAIEQNIQKIKQGDFSDKDLTRTKNSLLSDLIYQKDKFDDSIHHLGLLEIVGLPLSRDKTIARDVNRITKADIEAVAKKYLTGKRRVILTIDPKS